MAANEKQVGGSHYGGGSLQHWDIVDRFQLDYFQGQITKYVMRWKKKNGLEDLKKAQHFLEKYIEIQAKEPKPKEPTKEEVFQEQRSRELIKPHPVMNTAEVPYGYRVEGYYGDGTTEFTHIASGKRATGRTVEEAFGLKV